MLQDKAKEMTTRKRTERGQMERFGNEFIGTDSSHRELELHDSFLVTLGRRLLPPQAVEHDHAAITPFADSYFSYLCFWKTALGIKCANSRLVRSYVLSCLLTSVIHRGGLLQA